MNAEVGGRSSSLVQFSTLEFSVTILFVKASNLEFLVIIGVLSISEREGRIIEVVGRISSLVAPIRSLAMN